MSRRNPDREVYFLAVVVIIMILWGWYLIENALFASHGFAVDEFEPNEYHEQGSRLSTDKTCRNSLILCPRAWRQIDRKIYGPQGRGIRADEKGKIEGVTR